MPLHIENKTREDLPHLPFEEIKNYSIGQGYELSLVFVSHKTSRTINQRYRQKDNPTNILSFPLTKTEGEILIDIKLVKKEARDLQEKDSSYLKYIFIHGLLHLKGLSHGSRMEVEERRIMDNFSEK